MELDNENKVPLEGSIEVTDAEKLAEMLNRALTHVEDQEAEYWIRSSLQHLIAEQADVDASSS